ncbi:hypothetical protein Geu3261_0185_003 [Komagataeibacter europaeus NBRC 3261]|uniref:Uncharacterized protein n=1 Tax=Komagataeibacter europaeus NBRC 3261 TaxID=1234669 RepID=A0A0D6Q3W5_KOMEU|nr:hypothetical protein [Komagataeibacter europaeus]GAN97451.1 hypothetical protein Geu3261_0185_003 [Komagataeibacter europaeus NBRC 3261]
MFISKFKKLRTIDFSHIGLGDNIMAWAGLYTILLNDIPAIDSQCTIYVPRILHKFALSIFSKYGIDVKSVSSRDQITYISPVFSAESPNTKSLKELYNSFIGPDWRINCFEALDLQKKPSSFSRKETIRSRLRLNISERIFYNHKSWENAQPAYVGYRLWLPIAHKMDIMPVQFMSLMKRSLNDFRKETIQYIDGFKHSDNNIDDILVFPVGKSFQTFTPEFCKDLSASLAPKISTFYLPKNDVWHKKYKKYSYRQKEILSIDEIFFLIKNGKKIITTDSFSSHIAQIIRDDFTLVLTRDFRENVLHPGASPRTVMHHPVCAPCHYVSRATSKKCPVGLYHCAAFDQKTLITDIVHNIN